MLVGQNNESDIRDEATTSIGGSDANDAGRTLQDIHNDYIEDLKKNPTTYDVNKSPTLRRMFVNWEVHTLLLEKQASSRDSLL